MKTKIKLIPEPPKRVSAASMYAEFFQVLLENPFMWAKFEGNPASARSSARCAENRNAKNGFDGVYGQRTVDKEHWFCWRPNNAKTKQ